MFGEQQLKIAESVQWAEDFPEEGWETSSELECSFSYRCVGTEPQNVECSLECSYAEDLLSGDVNQTLSGNKSKNVSVIDLNKSDSFESKNSSLIVQPNNSVSGRKKINQNPLKFILECGIEYWNKKGKPHIPIGKTSH